MADFYPLVSRAVAALDIDAPGAERRALYERARAALKAQLRSVQPPLSDSEITRERLFLEEAVRKVESEVAALRRERGQNSSKPVPRYDVYQSVGQQPLATGGDPLAELARLIRQADPFASPGQPNSVDEDPAAVGPPPWMQRVLESTVDTDTGLTPLQRYAAVHTEPDSSRANDAVSGELDAGARKRRRDATIARLKLSLPPISTLPEQNEKRAIGFRPSRRGPLELQPDPPQDFLDPEQSQLYARIRAQLVKLKEDTPSQERIQIDEVLNDFLDQPTTWQDVEFKKVLWLCGNSLRNKLAQHDAVKDSLDPHYLTLPAGVATALREPVQAWNIFVLGDPDLVELDAKRPGPREQQAAVENLNAAKPILENASIDREITTEHAANVLTSSLQAAESPIDNINTKQAQDLAEGTSRNLVVQIVRRAYLFCQHLVDPQTDEARALIVEYKKGIAKAAGAATFGAAVATLSYSGLHAASFFEFVAQNADVLKLYISISLQNEQLNQVIDVIQYTRIHFSEEKPLSDERTELGGESPKKPD